MWRRLRGGGGRHNEGRGGAVREEVPEAGGDAGTASTALGRRQQGATAVRPVQEGACLEAGRAAWPTQRPGVVRLPARVVPRENLGCCIIFLFTERGKLT